MRKQNELLVFETPTIKPKGWETAEAQAFRFPQRYVAKCQEFNDYAKGLAAVEKEKDHLFDFVVRNLISAMDNMNVVLGEIGPRTVDRPAAPDAEGAESNSESLVESDETAEVGTDERVEQEGDDQIEASTEPTPVAEAVDEAAAIARKGLESARRSLMNILEGLHIEPVELVGKSYREVEVNGRIIEDPFEVVEAKNQGKATELPVLEVITSLWVQTEPGVRIIRKGQVIC